MANEPKKLGPSMRPLIESILKKAVAAGNISPKVLEQRIKDLDLIDAGKKPTGKKQVDSQKLPLN